MKRTAKGRTEEGDNAMRGSKTDMPVTLEEAGVVIQDAVWDDLHVSFETFGQAFDSRPFHRGLPDDCCQCPH